MTSEARPRSWGTRFGFYMVAIGSAVGLGNLWRFPYVVSENGGGAFVLLFMFLAVLIGMPLLISELIIGKTTGHSAVLAIRQLSRGPFYRKLNFLQWTLSHAGWLMVGTCVVILAYYAVISGWVLHFVMQYLKVVITENRAPEHILDSLKSHGGLQIGLTSVHLLLIGVIVRSDLDKGIERWVGYMMPMFVALMAVLAYKALSLDGMDDAIKFFLYPDFSKLTPSSLGAAIGQLFFTLSIGFGSLVTFGSYMPPKTNVPIAGFRVVTLDSTISLFAGLLIFPLVFNSLTSWQGPDLLFRAVPKLLLQIPGGSLFGFGFFLCLYLASLGASVGLFETVVANFREALGFTRATAIWAVGGICLVLALGPALSSSTLSTVNIFGGGILETVDIMLVNWFLPIAALFVSLVVSFRLDPDVINAEFKEEEGPESEKLLVHFRFVLRWLVPILILTALFLQSVDLFLR